MNILDAAQVSLLFILLFLMIVSVFALHGVGVQIRDEIKKLLNHIDKPKGIFGLALATKEEAAAGTDTVRAVTPSSLGEAIRRHAANSIKKQNHREGCKRGWLKRKANAKKLGRKPPKKLVFEYAPNTTNTGSVRPLKAKRKTTVKRKK